MERIGIFGGSFDPPHIGHIQAARQAARALNLDRLLVVPVASSPHKGGCATSAEHRLAMLKLALAGEPAVEASDLEIRRGGVRR